MEEELKFGCRFEGGRVGGRGGERKTDLGYVQIEIQLILSGGVRQSILLLPYGGASSGSASRFPRFSSVPRLRPSLEREGEKKTGQLSGRPPNCSLITVPVARSATSEHEPLLPCNHHAR